MYMPPDVTATIRGSGLSARRGSSRETRTNGPRTIVAKVRSKPSAVTSRVSSIVPALSTMTSMRGSRARISAAAARTEPRSAMSATTVVTSSVRRGRTQLGGGTLEAARIAADQHETGAHPGERAGGGPAEARTSGPVSTTVRPAIGERLRVLPARRAAAEREAETGEAGDDEDLGKVVDEGSQIDHTSSSRTGPVRIASSCEGRADGSPSRTHQETEPR